MIRHIVDQHADEAAFLWQLRDAAAVGPRYTLSALADLDERVEAHLDGLRVAGPHAWEACAEVLPLETPGEVFVVAALALHAGAFDKLASILDAAGLDPVRSRGIVSAIGWTPLDRIDVSLRAFLEPRGPAALQRFGIAGAALHRADPGPPLTQALFSTDAPLKARALRAVGELGRMDLRSIVRQDFGAADADVRFWAAWSAALLGDAAAAEVLWSFAEGGGQNAVRAIQLAARASPLAIARVQLERVSDARTALLGAVALGDPAGLPRLFDALREPSLARLAGHGIASMTGIDTWSSGFVGRAPEGFSAGPTDDPRDEAVALDPDDVLPWPNADAIEAACRRLPLAAGIRHFAGEPVSEAVLERVLLDGTQSQRMAAAIERCVLSPGVPLEEVRAPGFRQQRGTGEVVS
jgi:uncharacterized protein (TIGR02270 family)